MEPHGLSRWRHGCSRITPVSPRRRPGGDTVAPGVYHGIWQPSRLLPVSPGCFKHFKTTGDMSRFNTVQHGSSRISKVVHGAATVPPRLWHGSSRIIKPGWTGTLNRDSENGALINNWEIAQNNNIRPRGYKTFSYSTQLRTKFILLTNVKIPTMVGILTFISRINTTSERFKTLLHLSVLLVFMRSWNSVLSWVEHGKSCITSGPGLYTSIAPEATLYILRRTIEGC